jgi:hypothetical protein
MVGSFCISSHSKKFHYLLASHYDLGAHTDIYVYSGDRIFRYCWSHPTVRPFGNPLPLQCSDCGILTPWSLIKSEHTKSVVVLHCKGCRRRLEYKKGQLMMLGDGQWTKDEGVKGRWYGQWMTGKPDDAPPTYNQEAAKRAEAKKGKRVTT